MTDDGAKPPRDPYPSDEAPTVRTDLAELLERVGQSDAAPAAAPDFGGDTYTDITEIEPLRDQPAEVPRAVRRKRVQTVMGVAPPPVAQQQRAAAASPAPFVVPGPAAPQIEPDPTPPPPPPPQPAAVAPPAARSEPSVQIAQNPDRTAPRRALSDVFPSSAAPIRVPFSALVASTLLSALTGAAAAIAVVLLMGGTADSAPESTAETIAAAAAPVEKPRPASPVLLERARSGEPAAVAELETKPPANRSVEEALALSHGRSAAKRAEIAELRKALASDPKPTPEQLDKLRGWADDADLTREALALMASLPGATGADLIYDVWVGNPGRTVATSLAEELVQTRSVRSKASPALGVALDLRLAKTCDEVAPVIKRAKQVGDRRSMHLIGRLTKRKGCGLESDAACVPCALRLKQDLTEAAFAVQARKPPKL